MTGLIGAAFGRPCSTSFLRPLSIIQVWSFDVSRTLDLPACPRALAIRSSECGSLLLGSQEILGDPPMNRVILIARHPILANFWHSFKPSIMRALTPRPKAVRCLTPKDMAICPRGWLVVFIPKRKLPTDLQPFQRDFLFRGASTMFRILAVNKVNLNWIYSDLFQHTGFARPPSSQPGSP